MALLNWDNNYSVGVGAMDDEHKKLLAIMNNLYDSMKAGKSKEVLDQVFQDLIDYTKFHFSDEEALMKQVNYPGLNEQLIQHKELTNKVLEYQNKFKTGALFVSIEVMDFLKNWLINHILRSDKKYGEFINKK